MPLSKLKACSLSVGTSLYLVTLPWTIHGAIRYLASALLCGITVTGLRARGIFFCESEGVVCELTVTGGIDRDTIHKLLFAQRRRVVGDHESGTFKGIRGRVSYHSALPLCTQELCG